MVCTSDFIMVCRVRRRQKSCFCILFCFACVMDLPNNIVWNFVIEDLLENLSACVMIFLQSAIFSQSMSVSAELIYGNM